MSGPGSVYLIGRRCRRALAGDAGSASVTSAWVIAVVLAVTLGVLTVIRAETAAHSARAAADLSALAGAHALRRGADACAEARFVAARNGARVRACRVDADDVVVGAEVDVDLGRLGAGPATAVARAGPG